ncbi:MAG: NAD(P)-dependent oxidoreductase [Polynucleobacter sp.]|jgi:3-hydroxyisobutyrate dehydrogenase-like beta-hydroxyacid dehydrogenase|nr:NAD(P)-dependent oxidoreductase [Polynucleobacter sp.]
MMVQKEQMTSPVIGIIGLGIMGGIMAETLLGSGFKVIGFDLEKAACKRLSRAGGEPLKSTQDVVYKADIMITSLATSQALRLVYTQIQEALSKSPKKLILVETSTLPMADKELIAQQLKKPGVSLLDCPISGTAARMKDRAWTIFVSGNKKICQQISPIFKCLSDNAPYVGAYGNGLKMKMIANHLVAIYNVASAESVIFAKKIGLDPKEVLDIFGPSPVIGTGVMRLRMPFMIDRKYTPATMKVEVWQKDMQVIGELAKSVGCPLPIFNATAPIYTAAMAQGFALEDTASTAEVIGTMAGLYHGRKGKNAP